MFAVSAIVCSHNPREDYLRRVLSALKAQTLSPADWELLLVDHASDQPIAGRFDVSWHPHGRRVREDNIGPTHARLRGIAESKGGLLVFVEDDNVLRADYLQTCLKIAGDYSWLGAWNGSCIPEYEVEPPAELRPWLGGLQVEKLSVSVWARLPMINATLPTSAGLAVRRAVAEHYREQALAGPWRQALARSGDPLAAGEDIDLALSGYSLGLGAGRFPELELTHLISARRLTLGYLEDLHERLGYSSTMLSAIYDQTGGSGQVATGALKMFLLRMAMFAAGKSRTERRIRLAEERGRMAARQDLQRLTA